MRQAQRRNFMLVDPMNINVINWLFQKTYNIFHIFILQNNKSVYGFISMTRKNLHREFGHLIHLLSALSYVNDTKAKFIFMADVFQWLRFLEVLLFSCPIDTDMAYFLILHLFLCFVYKEFQSQMSCPFLELYRVLWCLIWVNLLHIWLYLLFLALFFPHQNLFNFSKNPVLPILQASLSHFNMGHIINEQEKEKKIHQSKESFPNCLEYQNFPLLYFTVL